MKKTKIICTIGPKTESPKMLRELVNAGMNIARINFSYGDNEEHIRRINDIREMNKELNLGVGILVDTRGPEIRLGDFENASETYSKGEEVTIVKEKMLGTHEKFYIHRPELFNAISVGDVILINEGIVKLTVIDKNDKELRCRFENPSTIEGKMRCNIPNIELNLPFLSMDDESDIRFSCEMKVDYIAVSFTRTKEDVLEIRKILAEENCEDIQIIAKIENQEGYDNLDEILEVADGITVARGELGMAVSVENVPIYQERMITRANALGKPVITASHMMESMQHNPSPTRAETSDVANAILEGTDAIMLSGESAIGMYPIEAVKTMVMIAEETEQILPYRERLQKSIDTSKQTGDDAIGISVANTVLVLDVAAIVVFTASGTSAKRIAKFRPACPVYAATFDDRTRDSLAIHWGVTSVVVDKFDEVDKETKLARDIALSHGCKKGDEIIIVTGYPFGLNATNSMRIIEV